MKWIKPRFIAVFVLGLLITEIAWAHGHPIHHHRAHVGIAIGIPLVTAPWYYPPTQIYPNPPVTPLPQAYIEMNSRRDQPSGSWWYYCNNPEGYYPYIKECPQGWQLVDPEPSDFR